MNASVATLDSGKVRLGGLAKTLPKSVEDSGRVRLGGLAKTLPKAK